VTPGGVKLLARSAKRGIVETDYKRALLFLYGRDLFDFKVVKPPCKEGYVLVYWKGALLGLGRLAGSAVYNVLDFGEFLRRGF
jgi:NOL1/NOP2/fmu family ribosome biogenesis protein